MPAHKMSPNGNQYASCTPELEQILRTPIALTSEESAQLALVLSDHQTHDLRQAIALSLEPLHQPGLQPSTHP